MARRGAADAGLALHRRIPMSRVRLTLIALNMAFALPALTGADVPPVTSSADESVCATCAASQPEPDYQDTRWPWRLHVYRHLDCVTEIVDRALTANGAARTRDRVEVSRTDLERIRALAWQARDAAARIGQ